ncbi:MAG: hypothetical protein KF884_01125 [Fimbriimonadaceae bacterium]|nr:hypothetical protein [Fimbriimonadaceae bacterium]QYK58698.1 MAG: hypothetical protein KF884_01125 [Fimbriimonadaceae bacterium]
MTTKQIQTLLTLVALAVIGGCGSGGATSGYKPKPVEPVKPVAVPAGQEASLFPVKVGAQWVFAGQSSSVTPQGSTQNEVEVVFKVVKVDETPEGKVATLEVSTDGVLGDRVQWRVGPKGVMNVSASRRNPETSQVTTVAYNPPFQMLSFPLKAGEVNTVTTTGVRPGAPDGPMKVTTTNLGVQEVDTKGVGRVSAYSTQTVSEFTATNLKYTITSTSWWAPEKGLVRYLQEVSVNKADDNRQVGAQVVALRLRSKTP